MAEVRWFQISGSKFRWITVCASLSQPAEIHCFSGRFLWNLHLLRNLPKYVLWDKNTYSKLLSRYLRSILITFDPGQCFLSWLNSGSCLLKLRGAHFVRHGDYLPSCLHFSTLATSASYQRPWKWQLQFIPVAPAAECRHRPRETRGDAQQRSLRKGFLLIVSLSVVSGT